MSEKCPCGAEIGHYKRAEDLCWKCKTSGEKKMLDAFLEGGIPGKAADYRIPADLMPRTAPVKRSTVELVVAGKPW